MLRKLLNGRTSVLASLMACAALMTASVAVSASGPSVVGDWEGALDTGNGTLRIVIHFSQDKDGNLKGDLDSPDQGASGIPITTITYKEPDLHFEVGSVGGSYDGKMNKDNSAVVGTWTQGQGLALTFKRVTKTK
ncbi:MAG TPA: hypothetical protein VI756_19565 [Blastocatellia bacterium]